MRRTISRRPRGTSRSSRNPLPDSCRAATRSAIDDDRGVHLLTVLVDGTKARRTVGRDLAVPARRAAGAPVPLQGGARRASRRSARFPSIWRPSPRPLRRPSFRKGPAHEPRAKRSHRSHPGCFLLRPFRLRVSLVFMRFQAANAGASAADTRAGRSGGSRAASPAASSGDACTHFAPQEEERSWAHGQRAWPDRQRRHAPDQGGVLEQLAAGAGSGGRGHGRRPLALVRRQLRPRGLQLRTTPRLLTRRHSRGSGLPQGAERHRGRQAADRRQAVPAWPRPLVPAGAGGNAAGRHHARPPPDASDRLHARRAAAFLRRQGEGPPRHDRGRRGRHGVRRRRPVDLERLRESTARLPRAGDPGHRGRRHRGAGGLRDREVRRT